MQIEIKIVADTEKGTIAVHAPMETPEQRNMTIRTISASIHAVLDYRPRVATPSLGGKFTERFRQMLRKK